MKFYIYIYVRDNVFYFEYISFFIEYFDITGSNDIIAYSTETRLRYLFNDA